jgi:hypothetical protein
MRGYIKLPAYGYGFFSNFFRILDHIKVAVEQGLEPYVDCSETAWVVGYNPFKDVRPPKDSENPWDWWFDQEPLVDTPTKVELDHLIFMHHTQVWKRPDVPEFRKVFDNHVKIKQHILDRVEEIYNEKFRGKVVLGVMARGCEFNAGHPDFGNQTIETWISACKNVLADHKEIDMLFVVTEDGHFLPRFDAEFGAELTYYLPNVFRRTDETLEYMNAVGLWAILSEHKRPNHKRLLGEECLIQALLLSRCDYLVVKVCGTSNAAVFFSDNVKDVFYT